MVTVNIPDFDWAQAGWFFTGLFFMLMIAFGLRMRSLHKALIETPRFRRSEKSIFEIPGKKVITEWEE
jgi:hypothetical protein